MNPDTDQELPRVHPIAMVSSVAHPPEPIRFLSPLRVDEHWQPLQQAWLGCRTKPQFQAGWARLRWNPGWFCVETIFLCNRPANRANRLNQRTWELGDVCEVFLQDTVASKYLEIHVTPENQRLQLEFGENDIARVQRGTTALEEFCIKAPDWAESSTHHGPGFWATQVILPATRFGSEPLSPTRAFIGTVCRYDCDGGKASVLSATALFAEPNFHHRADWHRFELVGSTD